MAVTLWSAGVIPGGAVGDCCTLPMSPAVLPFTALDPTKLPESGNWHHSSQRYYLNYACIKPGLCTARTGSKTLLTVPSLHYIACDSLTVSSWDSPGRKMLLELAALFRESFTKMLSLLLCNRLMHSEDGGDLLRSQGTSSSHKPRVGLCQTSGSYWKTGIQWDLWIYLKLSSWEVECQGLWKSRYFSFLSKIFEKILGHVLPVVYNRLTEESIFMGSSLFKIKR